MAFDFVDLETAKAASGIRMIVVSGVPSPWGEAAKGILHVKSIDWKAVALDQRSEDMAAWSPSRTGPVAFYNDEAARSGWAEILLLAERLSPTPALIPTDIGDRALMFGLSHELMGEGGLLWCRRLQSVHSGLTGGAGFPEPVARYLAAKYGYLPEQAGEVSARVSGLLGFFADRLKKQAEKGSDYLIGNSFTAADIYFAAGMALFGPLPQEHCALDDGMRAMFSSMDDTTRAALDPVLMQHRDRIYDRHLELPMRLTP